jgi:transcriptional regulator with XRE-family HTH domain
MANFFEERRARLGLSLTKLAARLDMTAQAVQRWEAELNYPSKPIRELALAYEVTEQRMADEVIALRMRIERREAAAVK